MARRPGTPLMLFAYVSILGLALLFAAAAHRDTGIEHRDVMQQTWRQLAPLLVRLPVALIAAGFIGELIPQALFGRWLGDASGVPGVLMGTLLGGIMPGGPIVTFPLVLVLERAGVGTPQLIALLTSWSCFALHRVLAYELPTLGWAFVWRRWAVTLLLAPLAGLLTLGLH